MSATPQGRLSGGSILEVCLSRLHSEVLKVLLVDADLEALVGALLGYSRWIVERLRGSANVSGPVRWELTMGSISEDKSKLLSVLSSKPFPFGCDRFRR